MTSTNPASPIYVPASRERLLVAGREKLRAQQRLCLAGPPGMGLGFLGERLAAAFDVVHRVDADDAASTATLDELLARRSPEGSTSVLVVLRASRAEGEAGRLALAGRIASARASQLWLARVAFGDAAMPSLLVAPVASPSSASDVASSEAGRIFLAAAADGAPGKVVGASTLERSFDAIARCDGMPLALVAMGRRLGALGPDALQKDAPPRELFAPALADLPASTLGLARALALFDGSFTTEAALARGGVEDLQALCDRGLVVPIETARDHRLRLLLPIRALLGDHAAPLVATHHALALERFLHLTSLAELTGQTRALAEEQLDLAACLRYQAEIAPDRALALIAACAAFFGFASVRPELRDAVQRTLAELAPRFDEHAMARAWLAHAGALRSRGAADEAEALLATLERIATERDDQALLGRALRQRGALLVTRGECDEAVSVLHRALDALDAGSDDVHRGTALDFLGLAEQRVGHYDAAAAHLQEAVLHHEALGHRVLVLYENVSLANLHVEVGDLRRARLRLAAAIDGAQRLEDDVGEAYATISLALCHLVDGRDLEALEACRRAQDLYDRAGHENLALYCVGLTGIIELFLDRPDEALAHLERGATCSQRGMAQLAAAYLATLDLGDGLVDKARASAMRVREACASATDPAALALASFVLEGASPAAAFTSVELRVASRWVERLRARGVEPAGDGSEADAATLVVAPDGAWFTVRGQRVALGGKPVLKRLLGALADRHRRAAGQVTELAALVRLVWPDEKMLEVSARARIHACVLRLRRLGLGAALLQAEGGYALGGEVRVEES